MWQIQMKRKSVILYHLIEFSLFAERTEAQKIMAVHILLSDHTDN